MNEIVKRLGERIRFLRKERGLSQEQLGELAGLHTNYVGQIERGEKNLTIDSLQKVSAGLNVPLEQLFKYIDIENDKEGLREIVELLSQRPERDYAMVLQLLRTVFDWQIDAKSKSNSK